MLTKYQKAAFMLQGTLAEYTVSAGNLIKLINFIDGDCDTYRFNKLPKNLQDDIKYLLDECMPCSDDIENGLDSAKFFRLKKDAIDEYLIRVEKYYRHRV